jgi:large subunit ribosomal protein L10|tara:strand:+ start:150 stop:665 length:516 start_codon:yes stop_codon:yes gene_type:complete
MNKAEKIKVIDDLSSSLSESKNLYLTDISGLNASQTSDLRRACYKADIKLSVVKNTMLHRAIEASNKDFGDITSVLKGNTSIMFSESGNEPAKIIKQFRKKNDKPILKAAFIEEAIYIGDNQLDILVAIKSREELIGEVVGLLKSPIQNLVSALNAGGKNLSGVLKTLSER